MAEPFVGEIRMVGFTYPPRGWAFCDGQVINISQNMTLYALLGSAYGGDGLNTFGLPDLRGRTPIHVGSSGGANHLRGEHSGEETHKLSDTETAKHSHAFKLSTTDASLPRASNANNSVLASASIDMYRSGSGNTTLIPDTISTVGAGQTHENMQPTQVVNFCIAMQGFAPTRN